MTASVRRQRGGEPAWPLLNPPLVCNLNTEMFKIHDDFDSVIQIRKHSNVSDALFCFKPPCERSAEDKFR